MSTSGDVHYIGGGGGDIMSRSGDVQHLGGYHDACGGYHEYIGRCSVHRGDTTSTSGDIMSTSGGYHEYIGGCSVHWWIFSTLGFSIEIERLLPTCSPTCIMISLRCTEHPLMYS